MQKVQTKVCLFCGKSSVVEVDNSTNQINRWLNGELIQNVWPELSAAIREQLISGTHDECWNEHMIPEDEDES